MSELLESAKKHASSQFAETEPNDDIMPFMTWDSPYGWGMMPITSMGDDPEKDVLSVYMTTAIAVARATEVVFASAVWGAPTRHNKDGTRVMPSEHEDREEMFMLLHCVPGKDVMHMAKIHRTPDTPPLLGEWADSDEKDARPLSGGRFANAIHLGFDVAGNMPPEIVALVDRGWELGESVDLMRRFAKVHFDSLKDLMGDQAPDGSGTALITIATDDLNGKDSSEAGRP